MKKRSNITVMAKLIGLVRPLTGYMILAIFLGLLGHLCASLLTVFGGYALLGIAGVYKVPTGFVFTLLLVCAFARGFLRYGEQSCNHFIAFKLLALLRDRVFFALRKLSPAKLEGRDRGDLIAVITSDIELLEVFYAHTISPAVIAFLFTVTACVFIGSFHPLLGVVALAAYLTVGLLVPFLLSKANGDNGLRFRKRSGALSGFVLDSLRGLSETIQYGQGAERLRRMNEQTDALTEDEARMKRLAGRGTAVTGAVILTADLVMLVCASFLYQSGAGEVHIRTACPPLLYGCKYLNFSRSSSEMELITRRTIKEMTGNAANVNLSAYSNPDSPEYQEMVKRIGVQLNFTSLRFHRLDDMIESVGIDRCKLCTYCWDGRE